MALVSAIITDALTEIGVTQPGETPTAADQAIGLLRLQNLIDAWNADQLTLVLQLRTTYTVPSSTTTITVGTGGDISIPRPLLISSLNYIVPGTSPGVEVPIGLMDRDSFAALSIKQLASALPIQAFYQTDVADAFGTLQIWPKITQNVQLVLYTPQGLSSPATTATNLIGPYGYQEAVMYQLALRLCGPYGKPVSDDLRTMAAGALRRMGAPNVQPGLLGTDPALIPSLGAGYNVFSDQMTSSNTR